MPPWSWLNFARAGGEGGRSARKEHLHLGLKESGGEPAEGGNVSRLGGSESSWR